MNIDKMVNKPSYLYLNNNVLTIHISVSQIPKSARSVFMVFCNHPFYMYTFPRFF